MGFERASIDEISFSEIEKVWREKLWPGRKSPIEALSWIDSSGRIDMKLSLGKPKFWALHDEEQILSVVSGFQTGAGEYRSRGLWVSEAARGQGLGRRMMDKVLEEAQLSGCRALWTMPRSSSVAFYLNCGFLWEREVSGYEFGPHAIVRKSWHSR